MRLPVIPAIFLLLVSLSAAVIVPNVLVLVPQKQDVARQLSAQSGLEVTLNGPMRLRVLPRPQLIIETVSAQLPGDRTQALKAELMLIDIAPLALWRGQISVQRFHLIGADVNMQVQHGVSGLLGQALALSYPAIKLMDLKVTLQGLNRFDGARAVSVGDLSVDLPARQAGADFTMSVRRHYQDRADARFRLHIGPQRNDIMIALDLAADESVRFNGFISSLASPNAAEDWQADGEMTLDSAGYISALVERHLHVALQPAARRVAFSGLVQVNAAGMRTENLEITALNTVFQSRLALAWPQQAAARPSLTGRLSTGVIDLNQMALTHAASRRLPNRPAMLGGDDMATLWGAFAKDLGVALRVEATRFDMGGETGQNLLLAFDWQGQKINVSRLSLGLPFRSLLLASGAIDLATPSFQGSFSTRSTDALAAALWLSELADIDSDRLVERVDEASLQRISLVGDVDVSATQIRLDALSGRLGDDRLSGHIHLALGGHVQGAVDMQIERLDLADWGLVDTATTRTQSFDEALISPLNKALAAWLKEADAARNIRLRLDSNVLYAGVTEFGPMQVTAQIADQELVLQDLQFADFDGLALALDGRMSYAATMPHGQINATIKGVNGLKTRLGGPLRNLLQVQLADDLPIDLTAGWRLPPPDAPEWPNSYFRGAGRFGDVAAVFSLQGPSRSLAFDAVGQTLDIDMQGTASNIATLVNLPLAYDETATGQLTLKLQNQSADVATMAVDMALQNDRLSLAGTVRRGAGGRRVEGALGFQFDNVLPLINPSFETARWPVAGEVQIVSDAQNMAFSGLTAQIGDGVITGEGVLNMANPTAKLNANLVADNLDLSWLLPRPTAQGWSDAPMEWALFSRADMDVEWRGQNLHFGALTLEEMTARWRLVGGVLEAPQINGQLLGGTFEGEVLAEGGALNPYFNIQARYSDIGMAALFGALYTTPVLDTQATGTLTLSGRGTSLAAMMGSLAGEVQVNMSAGALDFVDMAGFKAAVLADDFDGEAAPFVSGQATKTPFLRAIGLADMRNGQAERATLDFVFDETGRVRDARFDGQFDFVSRQMAADFKAYPSHSEKALVWSLSGAMAAPQIKLDASDFDRLPPAQTAADAPSATAPSAK